ncbi:MAG: ATP synthase F1 subunit delta [Flavobacteriaceae bacterium]|jgi:F-type H+-transporting ATPase subunit delta|nr:ATP synthase F1 subunit delta [Flavobacteriaceae bacterium]
MPNVRVARRYAEGLWGYAQSVKEESAVVADMQSLLKIIKESRELQLFLKSPIIETKKKIQIACEMFKSFSQTSQHFITIVFRHHREIELLGIANQVLHIYDDYNGIQRVSIVSAIPLDKDIISGILTTNSHINAQKAIVKNAVDETIIGGYILRVGDEQVDASVKNKLNNIKKKLEEKVF